MKPKPRRQSERHLALLDAFNAVSSLNSSPHRAGPFKRKAIKAIARLIVREKDPHASEGTVSHVGRRKRAGKRRRTR